MPIKDMKSQFCEKINELRAKKNWSAKSLAERSGVPLEMLEQLERGAVPKEMTVEDVILLARVFQCKPQELFE